MNISSGLRTKYDQLFDGCESDLERKFVNGLYRTIRDNPSELTDRCLFFMKLKQQFKPFEDRRIRLDFAADWRGKLMAIECEGGTFSNKQASIGYRSIGGYHNKVDKYNLLAKNGWLVFRIQSNPKQLNNPWQLLPPLA